MQQKKRYKIDNNSTRDRRRVPTLNYATPTGTCYGIMYLRFKRRNLGLPLLLARGRGQSLSRSRSRGRRRCDRSLELVLRGRKQPPKCSVQFGLVWFGSVRFGLVSLGLGSVRFCSVWLGLGSVVFCSVQFSKDGHEYHSYLPLSKRTLVAALLSQREATLPTPHNIRRRCRSNIGTNSAAPG